jgi:hypothetical protein
MKEHGMIINVEAGELAIRVDGERVNLVHHSAETGDVMISLSQLAAHNLGVVLPDLAREAGNAIIGNSVNEMRRR